MALIRRMTIKFSLLILALAALPLTPSKALDMKNIFEPNLSKLELTCPHEAKPLLPKETQILYDYALYCDLYNM